MSHDFVTFVKGNKKLNLGNDFLYLFSFYFFADSVQKINKVYKIFKPYSNISSAVAYYLNNKMARGLYKHTSKISYVSDYPVCLNRIGQVGILKPNLVKLSDANSDIGRSRNHSLLWLAMRRKLFLEYVFNRKNYKNIWEYFKIMHLKKGYTDYEHNQG